MPTAAAQRRCIAEALVCDCRQQCDDGADEAGCNPELCDDPAECVGWVCPDALRRAKVRRRPLGPSVGFAVLLVLGALVAWVPVLLS